jgi:hypothetical protein
MTSAGMAVDSETLEEHCQQTPDAAQTAKDKTAVKGIVTDIDRKHGVLEIETEVGRAQIIAPPEATHALHPGAEVTLCMADEEPEQNLLQDSIIT